MASAFLLGETMRRWGVGCGVVLLLFGFLVVRACHPGDGASYVRLIYPEVRGAPVLMNVRVLWAGENAAYDELWPGQTFGYLMYPIGGEGELTVLFTRQGEQHAWSSRVGTPHNEGRFGVTIRIDSNGTVTEEHCKHPCPGSERPWYEPYRTRALALIGLE